MSELIVLSPNNNRVVVTPGVPFVHENGKLWQLRGAQWREVTSHFVVVPEVKRLKSREAVITRLDTGEWPDGRRKSTLTASQREHLRRAAQVRLSREEIVKLARELGKTEAYTRLLIRQARKDQGIRLRRPSKQQQAPQAQGPTSAAPDAPKGRGFSFPGIGHLVLLTQAEARILLSAARTAANPTPELTLALRAVEGQVQR